MSIIVKIQGGLGNQLFQYAYARKLSEIFKTPFKLDITSYDATKSRNDNPDQLFKRGYGIRRFNTIEIVASDEEINMLKRYQKKDGRIWYLRNKIFADESIYIQERCFNFNSKYDRPEALKKNKDIYLDGYWQTEKYFKEIEDIIRKEFVLKNTPGKENAKMIELIRNTESVCMHVRRGNFLLPKYRAHHGICPPDYYEKAVWIMQQQLKSPVFFVFSDDPEWVKENIKTGLKTIYVNVNGPEKDYEDLRLMGACKNHIIANSSFSWWGAWLSENKNKKVVYPSKIVRKNWNMSDFAPEGWTKIEILLS